LEEKNTIFRVGAVSYLNTVPLVWGMLHGEQRSQVQISFSIPSVCALEVARREVQVGLVPVAEIARQDLEIVPGVGIASRGPVRSILLFSKVPLNQVRSLAADRSSRTSVELARIILRERYGVQPRITEEHPSLEVMLSSADAALVIGDPALRIEPSRQPLEYLDLGAEWWSLTRLPMVFAAWAGHKGLPVEELMKITRASRDFGLLHLPEIVAAECPKRGISDDLGARYFDEHIRFEIGAEEQKGLEQFWELAGLRVPLATSHSSRQI